jgi:hypothetical protein
MLPGYGLRRTGQGVFPSVLLMAEEPLPPDTTLDKYVQNQLECARILLKQLKIKGPTPAAMPGATGSQRLGISYLAEDGRSIAAIQIYATNGPIIGNVTFTTLESELPQVSAALLEMLRSLSFQAPSAPAPA